jgi:heme a synthase
MFGLVTMTSKIKETSTRLLRFFAYGSVVSIYILILIGGYVTTSNSGGACGESASSDSWPFCKGAVLPSLTDAPQTIEFTHRLFNFVVAFFVVGTLVLTWRRYRDDANLVRFSTATFIGLLAQVILGMVTVTSALNPVVSDAHLGLASAIFAISIVNALFVWNPSRTLIES